MECKTCKHWKEKRHYRNTMPEWGICTHLASGAADIDFYTNNNDGEWVETIVETLPDWYCKEYETKEVDSGSISKV